MVIIQGLTSATLVTQGYAATTGPAAPTRRPGIRIGLGIKL